MFDMMKKAQQMQKNLKQMQEDLKETEVSGKAANGLVSVVIAGTHELKSISIKPEAVDTSDLSMLEDLIVVAFNDALQQANSLAEKKVKEITGGIKIPGLLG